MKSRLLIIILNTKMIGCLTFFYLNGVVNHFGTLQIQNGWCWNLNPQPQGRRLESVTTRSLDPWVIWIQIGGFSLYVERHALFISVFRKRNTKHIPNMCLVRLSCYLGVSPSMVRYANEFKNKTPLIHEHIRNRYIRTKILDVNKS